MSTSYTRGPGLGTDTDALIRPSIHTCNTGFATKYIKQKFFMDVHPPLAKLLITFAAWFAGFRGNFDFKDIGK